MLIRKATVIIAVSSFLVSVVPVPAFAQALQPEPAKLTTSNGEETVVKLFDAFPNGGPQLTAQVANAIANDPEFAYKLVQYVRSSSKLNEAQKAAAEQGFAEALKRLRATMGGSLKDLPMPEAEPRRMGWLWLLVAAGVGAGLCIGDVICDDDNNKKRVSPN